MKRCRHSVSFRVEIVADFHRVARLALVVEIVHRRLEQERVLALRFNEYLHFESRTERVLALRFNEYFPFESRT